MPLTEGEITYRSSSVGSAIRASLPQSVLTHSQLPHQVEPRNERSFSLPSSDEEGGKTVGFDGRRDNVHLELQLTVSAPAHSAATIS